MDKKIERRYVPMDLRAAEDDEDTKITGYAAVFDKESEPLFFGMKERVRQGAFSESIERDDIRALWNHNPNYVLGRNKSGTLSLEEDDEGLYVEIDPPDTQWARDAVASIERGDVDQMSIGFQIINEERERGEDDEVTYILTEVKLFDVSPVTFPAYPDTSVGVRDALTQAGIDYEGLAVVVTRAQRGMELTDSDRDMIAASIEVLKSLDARGRETDSDSSGSEGQELDFEIERRKRQLIMLELENKED